MSSSPILTLGVAVSYLRSNLNGYLNAHTAFEDNEKLVAQGIMLKDHFFTVEVFVVKTPSDVA